MRALNLAHHFHDGDEDEPMEGTFMQPSQRVLIVDDESSLRTALFRVLDRQGFQVITANCRREAELLASSDQPLDLALVDLRLPDGDGIELMQKLRISHPNIQTIILTGHGSIELAVRATQFGAFHFLTKPFNMEELLSLITRALSHKNLQQENLQLKTALHRKYRFDNIIGQSEEISKVLTMVERVADSDSTVLISGESGTGKELVAKAIHYNSPRANKPFVPINCGAIPGELLESELFGHIKGAFTGAIANRTGRFELASGGTLFLDEIGELSLNLQVKLLRVLQERRFEPVGSAKTLEADIPLLLHHFVVHFNSTKNRNLTGFSTDALAALFHYAWPGNIRELENLVERLAILKGSGQVELLDLPEQYRMGRGPAPTPSQELLEIPELGLDFNSAVDAYENLLIMQALEKTGWNRNQAAALLKLNRTTLVEKIKKKGLRPPESEEMI